MDVKKAIEKRRSIRKYQDKEISNDLIRELVNAARLAPSGNNAQPFVIKIGYPGEEPKPTSRKSLDEIIFYR